ncbi:MAG: ABC transporter permease [Pyrinomonadaceae bacterium]
MQTSWQDLRYGVRMLWNKPGFTVVAVITLALGIGANTAIFSIVNAVLLRPLPFREAQRLVIIGGENLKSGDENYGASPADFRDWKSETQSFEAIAAHSGGGVSLTGEELPESVAGERVTEDYFKVYDTQPLRGRTFAPDEFKLNSGVIVLSYRLWQRRFAGDPALVGKPVSIGGKPVTVVGVMPPEFKQPAYAEVWTPLAQDSGEMKPRGTRYFSVSARLKPHVTLDQAIAEMRVVTARLAEQYPATNSNWGARVVPLREALVGDARQAILILFGAVGFVLFIASVNVSNLLLTRATARSKELAIRAALGATRWRVMRQLIIESLLLCAIGGAVGLLLAFWAWTRSSRWFRSLYFPLLDEARVDLTVFGFAFAISVLTGVILGLLPALKASRPDLNESLKEGGRGATAGWQQQRTRNALVVAEIALTLVLLVGAGLLIRSLASLQSTDLGFNPRNLIAVSVGAGQDAASLFTNASLRRRARFPAWKR